MTNYKKRTIDGMTVYTRRVKHRHDLTLHDVFIGICIVFSGAFVAGVLSALIFGT